MFLLSRALSGMYTMEYRHTARLTCNNPSFAYHRGLHTCKLQSLIVAVGTYNTACVGVVLFNILYKNVRTYTSSL